MADAALEASRRLDWRFLLPGPPGRVLLFSPLGPEAAAVLEREARCAEAAGVAGRSGEAPPFDLAVLRDPNTRELADAVARLGREGVVYVETTRPVIRPVVRRTLRRLGFESIEAYWHLPGFEDASAIVPLAERNAVRYLLGRPRGRRAGRLAARLGSYLVGTPLLGLVARNVSLVAKRELASPRAALPPGATTGARPFVLLTPRFRASRHVVSLLLPPGGREPSEVCKRPRLFDDTGPIAREAAALRAVEFGAPGTAATAPRLGALRTESPDPGLLETALLGRPITPAVVREDRDGLVALALDWLTKLPRAAATEEPGWFERLVEEPLDRLAESFPPGTREAELVGRTRELCRPLRAGGFPLVLEHGDLAHPNLLLLPDGRFGAIDWELAEERGLPLHDLSFFLGYVARADHGGGPAAAAEALSPALLEPGGWVVRAITKYSDELGIPPGLRVPLFVASWARVASRPVSRSERSAATADGALPASLAGEKLMWLRGNRYTALWKRVVERAGDLDFGGGVDEAPVTTAHAAGGSA
jgi:Phosphotransferase enzyme family